MFFHITCEHQCQCAVTGYVASSTKAVLQCEDGQHQAGSDVIEAQHGDDQTQRGHDGAAGDAGGADSKDSQQETEQHHGAHGGQSAVEDLGHGHDEEHLGEDGAAQMDVGKQGDAEVGQILTQDRGLLGAAQSHGQSGGGGHGAHGGDVSGAVVLQDLHGVGTGVHTGQTVQHGQPQIMAHHDDQNDDQEHGQLLGDGALIGQSTEGAGDEEGQDGNDHAGDDGQHHGLELLQQLGDGLGAGPGGGQTDQHGENQSGHDTHDGGDLQIEQQLGQCVQALGRDLHGQIGDDGVASSHGQQSGTHRGGVSQHQSQTQHPGSVALQTGDGGGDKADDDQGHAEGNNGAHEGLQGQNDLHGVAAQGRAAVSQCGAAQTDHDTGSHAQQQLGRQAAKEFFQRKHDLSRFIRPVRGSFSGRIEAL